MNERDAIVVEAVREHAFSTLREGVDYFSEQFGVPGVVGAQDDFCCVLASRLAIEALKHFDIAGRGMKVQVRANNHAMVMLEETGDRDRWEAKALQRYCGLGTGSKLNEGWLNGHVVVIVEGEILLDPSAPQFNTITDDGRRLIVPPLALPLGEEGREWLQEPDKNWLGFELDEDLGGGEIFYRQSEDLSGLYDAPDWNVMNADPEAGTALAAAILARVRHRVSERLALLA